MSQKYTLSNKNNKAFTTSALTSKQQPITIVSSNPCIATTTTGGRFTSTCSKIPPNVVNRSQVVGNGNKLLQKSSPSPSVVTLSGVNKTAGGIIKSPSVVSGNRKHATINTSFSTNSRTSNNITVVNSSGQTNSSQRSNGDVIVSSNSGVTPSIYKTMTLSSNTAGRLSAGNGQIIFAKRPLLPTGKIIKSNQKGSLFIPINSKDIEKVSHCCPDNTIV